jgi:hypothetical protein
MSQSKGALWLRWFIGISAFLVSYFTFISFAGFSAQQPAFETTSRFKPRATQGDEYLIGVGKADITGYESHPSVFQI